MRLSPRRRRTIESRRSRSQKSTLPLAPQAVRGSKGPLRRARVKGRGEGRLLHDPRNQQEQVGIARFLTGRRQHRMHLATMMRLMIKEMAHQQPSRRADLAVGGAAEPNEVFGEPGVVDSRGPATDLSVGPLPRSP